MFTSKNELLTVNALYRLPLLLGCQSNLVIILSWKTKEGEVTNC